MGLIGISGKIGSGKSTVGSIILYLTRTKNKLPLPYGLWQREESHFHNHGDWQIKSFAGKLKECASIITGIPVQSFESADVKSSVLFENITVREILQKLGTEVGRTIHPDLWVNALMNDYTLTRPDYYTGYYHSKCIQCGTAIENCGKHQHFCQSCCINGYRPNWVITDMRFPNELNAVKDREGITIRVNRYSDIRVQHSGKPDDYDIVKFDPTNPAHVDLMHGESMVAHESETALDTAEFDYTIENNGTVEDLVEKVREILIKEKLL